MALDRRSFITFVVGGAAGTLFTPVPWKITDDISIWTQNWPWIPSLEYGEIYNVKSTCKLCASGCGLEIVTVAGRPVTAKGDQDHPMSQGGICPLGACAVQLLYSPSRIPGPMKKTGPDRFESITWEEAKSILEEKLREVQGSDRLAVVSGDENGTINELLSGFTTLMGSPNFFQMPGDYQTTTHAWDGLMNGNGQVGYDIENSDYVLMLGADALSNWGTPVRNQKAFSARKGKFVYAGPVQTGSGASADKWVPMKPGQQEALALGIAYYLIQEGAGRALGADLSPVRRNIVNNYDPGKVSASTGVAPDKIRELAMELTRASNPVVISGSETGKGNGSLSLAAGLLVNLLLDNLNKPGGMKTLPFAPNVVEAAVSPDQSALRSLVGFMQGIESGHNVPDVMMVYDANPVYALPGAEKAAEAFEQIPFKVCFNTFMDETAKKCDLLLPNPHFLERSDDAYTPFGSGKVVYSAARPVIDPIFNTMETGDVILAMAGKLGLDLGYNSLERVMRARAEAIGANWRNILRGDVYTSDNHVYQGLPTLPLSLGAAPPENGNAQYPVQLAPLSKLRIGNDKIAIPPFATVTIKESELTSDGFLIQINSATAFKHNLRQGQVVTLTSEAGTCKALVNIAETVMDDVAAILTGFGHTAWDEFSRCKGDNAYKLLVVQDEQGTGVPVWNRTRVSIA
ncbi:menaquinone reductase molybdopterin-binding-like subunit QrcB [Desulfonatronovibrio magnus]|uniref:menaquinone reductase molybdopterin-binding-like subunit QrcB n=1 Tax=Desulfonatronovibrio magnus TaxID=698827 RepID=UPI0005EB9D7C|nr:menaquinone reductase molybdopterin-binding-like subunit QrcB [Desulfonatronovibrio magnus]